MRQIEVRNLRPIFLGICAAFFFAFTFILNRAMELSGGSWIWSASLRFVFMLPFLLLLVMSRKKLKVLLQVMRENLRAWFLWSFVGFGLFYAPLCFAAVHAPGWIIAGTWQITIISGSLLAPLFIQTIETPDGILKKRGKIPMKGMGMSLIILLGIFFMQMEQAKSLAVKDILLGIIPVIVASFAYPLGNRKMMEICGNRLDAYQRVLGMTLASLPFWFLLSLYGLFTEGLPSKEQTMQSILVAICSGVIATILFFKATDMVKGDMQKLATVEATQSMEVLFAVIGELILLHSSFPSILSWCGMFVIMLGMIAHSYVSHKGETAHNPNISA
ncbi:MULTISPECIES: multidrug resistance efflux transporter family protein [Bacillus]|uniref:DMT family transporter n=1 Tax=Bacillus TaxID=1386 RepID=UPI001E58CE82|nr:MULTISPECIES: multidrug resistance efflux transporter family protein [Bacillus]MCE0739273.1 multidrug resistance efflux transporter family protein [Bacillus sp. G16]MCY7952959.1 multidrug resistance efflux transporter family protein [Bacillus inaquosorum]MCY7978960.1 multidrug resistance efflux transporter family protein [Bacillus inaquosorum]MEC0520540.1 multidrug resistance efflux transporter family protein [Bacillus inaquosorum]MEC0608953.1 multidrug resistance efflux transporter family 